MTELLRKLATAPRLLTILAGGLSLVRLINTYKKLGLQGTVNLLLNKYESFIDFFLIPIGNWISISMPTYIGHILTIWLLFGSINNRIASLHFKFWSKEFLFNLIIGPLRPLFIRRDYNKLQKENIILIKEEEARLLNEIDNNTKEDPPKEFWDQLVEYYLWVNFFLIMAINAYEERREELKRQAENETKRRISEEKIRLLKERSAAVQRLLTKYWKETLLTFLATAIWILLNFLGF